MGKFYQMHFNVFEKDNDINQMHERLKGLLQTETEEEAQQLSGNLTDEVAARYIAESFLLAQDEKELHELTAPDQPELVPNLKLESAHERPLTDTKIVQFTQTSHSVPIFGSQASVELDKKDQRLVAFQASLSDIPDVSPVATISPADALKAIAMEYHNDPQRLSNVAAPLQYFYLDENGDWHLVHHFNDVPIVPLEQQEGEHIGHKLGASPRQKFAAYDYLVDAHNGKIVFYYSSNPSFNIPAPCSGIDEYGTNRDFFALNTGRGFELRDPVRGIETYDFNFKDITDPSLPTDPINSNTSNFNNTPAGVSAHFYATQVYDFYNNVLKRKGVDDKGMKLVSLVNCTYSEDGPPPNWKNAVWWNQKMWYGQVMNGNGDLESLARHFDVIAHELTHGVTQTTSSLVYRNQSGALNESFSDIFGIIIKNWYPNEPNPISSWDWELGSGLGPTGLPLRDIKDPTRTGDPDHMNEYKNIVLDDGGVHSNSNIHNKAAYNLLTAVDHLNNAICSPTEIAILYYYTLTSLTKLATFSDCLRTLKSVAAIYYSGYPKSIQKQKIKAIDDAYNSVGIT